MRRLLLALASVMLLSATGFAQNVLEGSVKDSTGAGVPGATVTIKGTYIYAIADGSGKFKIATRQKLPFTLRITSAGYKAQEVQVAVVAEVELAVRLTVEREGERQHEAAHEVVAEEWRLGLGVDPRECDRRAAVSEVVDLACDREVGRRSHRSRCRSPGRWGPH